MNRGKHWRRRMLPSHVAACYVLYERGMSAPDIADLVWERFGYASPNAASRAILRFFHEGGREVRSLSESRKLMLARRVGGGA